MLKSWITDVTCITVRIQLELQLMIQILTSKNTEAEERNP